LRRNEFINFESKTSLGARNRMICILPSASDLIHIITFENTKLTNVGTDALAYLMSPPRGWANPKDCVEFPCTAPLNVLFYFKGTQYSSNPKFNYGSTFEVIANNKGISPYLKNCEIRPVMNAYICKNENLA